MSVPQQTWQATANYSGVEISQNAAPTGNTNLETATYAYQEFFLPSNYGRGTDSGETRLPDLTGFQFLSQIRTGYAASATADWLFQRYDLGVGWQTVVSGTEIGAEADGTNVWFTVNFDPIAVSPSQSTSKYRFGVRGRTTTNPVLNQVVEYDDSQGVAIISSNRVPVKLIPYKSTAITVNGIPGILVWNPEENEAVYSDQYGLESIWQTSPIPLAGAQAYFGTSAIANSSFCFRVLSASGDTGTDFLGNRYRSVVVRNNADNVSSLDGADKDKFWLSKPNPSKFAVECLYFDVRDTSGAATVFDQVVADPVTPGAWFSVYYSTEGDPGTTDGEWESKLWSHVPKAFRMTRREAHVLPEPVTAKYICIEFSHLQAQTYAPGDFVQKIQYKKHPKWVLDYFLVQNQNATTDPFIARNIQITYDALDLAFNYYTDDLNPSVLYPQPPSENALLTYLADRSDSSDAIDTTTLAQIDTVLSPYLQHPGTQASINSVLGEKVYNEAVTTATPSYPVESLAAPLRADTRSVSSTQREAVVAEQGFPVMYFYVTSRHKYREVEAQLEYNRAYFVGVKELSFTRNHYIAAHDEATYIESMGDNTNILVNDFVRNADGQLVVGDATSPDPPPLRGDLIFTF